MGYQRSLALQGWAVPGMAAPILLSRAQGHSLGAGSQPAPSLPAPSQEPEQSFAELSFHGIPAWSTHRASPCRIPKEPCEKPVLQTGIKSALPVPSALKGWECREGSLGLEVAHLIWEQILSCKAFQHGRVGSRNGNDGQEKTNDQKEQQRRFVCGELSWKNHLSAADAALEAQKIPIISTAGKG